MSTPLTPAYSAPQHPYPQPFDPLAAPLYGATATQALSRFFRKYSTFAGRASLSEYWWVQMWLTVARLVPVAFLLAGAMISAGRQAAHGVYGTGVSGSDVRAGAGMFDAPFGATLMVTGVVLFVVFWATTIVPSLAITWRRLHDADLSGAFWCLSFIPYVGWIPVLILTLQPSKPSGARYDAFATPTY